MSVRGSTIRSMTIFGMKWDVCQGIPALALRPESPSEPGKLSIRFRLNRVLSGLFGIKAQGDVDMTGLMEGIFGENFFDFTVLRYFVNIIVMSANCDDVKWGESS